MLGRRPKGRSRCSVPCSPRAPTSTRPAGITHEPGRKAGFPRSAAGGAKASRTPGLLHAISRQHVHPCLSSQVTVPERAHQSGQVRTGCCTFALYRSARRTRPPNERLTSQNLQNSTAALPGEASIRSCYMRWQCAGGSPASAATYLPSLPRCRRPEIRTTGPPQGPGSPVPVTPGFG
jgi:hypothetical protein